MITLAVCTGLVGTPSKWVVVRWEQLRRQNHWFDAQYNASCAGHLAGVRLVEEVKRAAAAAAAPGPGRRGVGAVDGPVPAHGLPAVDANAVVNNIPSAYRIFLSARRQDPNRHPYASWKGKGQGFR
jgi:hypothetical protein